MASGGKTSMTLVLFTQYFPYGKGEWFLETEIRYLAERFQRVIIVPMFVYGTRRSVPEGVTVVTCLGWPSERLTVRRIFQAVLSSACSPLFYQDIYARPQTVVQLKALIRLIGYIGKTIKVYKWLLSYIQRSDINIKDTLFYTYWLGPQSLAVGLAKNKYPEIKLISRAHGGDLYAERHAPPYIPLRKITLRFIDRIFAISDHGRRNLTEEYPFIGPRSEVSKMGVSDPGFTASWSTDNIFRIVSCSALLPVKRLELMIEGLYAFALARPGLLIEWHHLGDGPLRRRLEHTAKKKLPHRVRWTFNGWLTNCDVIEFYRTNQIDGFVNVSKFEGIPMSIMEALSCGIPVVAPSVGGIPEIVNSDHGVILQSNPTPQNIATALEIIASNEGDSLAKRTAIKQVWHSRYNADKNYNAFINRIMELFC